ncbi:MAG: SIMPL domain-containing protein [Candidatus Elarobacter sp.]
MKSITLALTAILALAASAPAAAQHRAAGRPSATIEVSGTGTIDRLPDQAIVTFTVVTNDDAAGRATSENNRIYNALVTRLRGQGIEPAAIKTTSYNVYDNPRPQQVNPQFQQRYGFVVTRGVSVTTDRTDQAGALVDAAVSAGVTDVNGISFGLKDPRGVFRSALAAAVTDAAAQAQALAAAAHVRIVRVVDIAAGGAYPVPRPVPQYRTMSAAAAPVPTEVQPGNLTVTATATVTYEIAP